MAKLTIDTSAPGEDLALIVNGSSMVVSERKFGDRMSPELLQDPWSSLFFCVQVAKPTKFSATPCVNFSFRVKGGRIIITREDLRKI